MQALTIAFLEPLELVEFVCTLDVLPVVGFGVGLISKGGDSRL